MRTIKQNQAAEIGRLVQIIDERNGDLGKKMRLRKEIKGQDNGRSHKIDKEVLSGSKILGDIERPWLTPPSPPPSPLPSPPLPPSSSDPEKILRTTHSRRNQRNTISQEQYRMGIKGTLWDGTLTKRQKKKNGGKKKSLAKNKYSQPH